MRGQAGRRISGSQRPGAGEDRSAQRGAVRFPAEPNRVGDAIGHRENGPHGGRVRRERASKATTLFPGHDVRRVGGRVRRTDPDAEVLVQPGIGGPQVGIPGDQRQRILCRGQGQRQVGRIDIDPGGAIAIRQPVLLRADRRQLRDGRWCRSIELAGKHAEVATVVVAVRRHVRDAGAAAAERVGGGHAVVVGDPVTLQVGIGCLPGIAGAKEHGGDARGL